MNSQVNSDQQEQQPAVFQDEQEQQQQQQFRQVCFNPATAAAAAAAVAATTQATAASSASASSSPTDVSNNTPVTTSNKRNSSSSSDSAKRIRLDTSASNNNNVVVPSSTVTGGTTSTTTTTVVASGVVTPATSSAISGHTINKTPKFIRRFRSRSLPIINFSHHHSTSAAPGTTTAAFYPHKKHHNMFSTTNHHINSTGSGSGSSSSSSSSNNTIPALPPINLQSLKEIDLHEILKNPQLRHDILFDPQLQFRPNLDGERGKRKKSIIDKYWLEIQKECSQFFNRNESSQTQQIKLNRLPILFTTLRDILLSLLPTKDRQHVEEILDIELLIQQLNHGSIEFVEMSNWLGDVFKNHCAPMRDQWVSEMNEKFVKSYRLNNVEYLVEGLRMIFQILEAMKLDVANHQIRILRPVLIETAIDFERDYFQTLINHGKITINDSLNWFYKKYIKKITTTTTTTTATPIINDTTLRPIITSSIIDLLSCRQMATEFPSTLTFDHTRLVLLRADVRQLVCVQLCVILYKQLIINAKVANASELLSPANISKVQQDILAIVTDDNGNIKWTKNITSISLQLVKYLYPQQISQVNLPKDLIDFSYNWLTKHIQPNSQVYGLMEIKIFNQLLSEIVNIIDGVDDRELELSKANTSPTNTSEMKNIATRIATLVKFHWNVFGNYYTDYIKSQHVKLSEQNTIINPGLVIKHDDDDTNKTRQGNSGERSHTNSIDNTASAPLSMFS
ncbi:Protein SOK1 [Spathaspora sp. JA1]|nr:Protein SOK1 [Spathaspora sp. JA1]